MAFNGEEKAKIRLYLGFPHLFVDHNTRLEAAMNQLGEFEAESEQVRGVLDELEKVDTMLGGKVLSAAGIKKVDEVEFFGSRGDVTQLDQIRSRGKQLVTRLEVVFGVGRNSDVFSPNGFGGTDWISQGSGTGRFGGGGMIPLG